MKQVFGVSWDDRKRIHTLGLLLVPVMLLSLLTPAQQQEMGEAASEASRVVSVIVREMPGAGSVPEQLVAELGGHVGVQIRIIKGFAAELPASGVPVLEAAPFVHSVSENRPVQLYGTFGDEPPAESGGGLVDGVTDVVDGATDVVDGAIDGATDVVDGAVDGATDVVDGAVDGATDVVDGAVDGATDVVEEVVEETPEESNGGYTDPDELGVVQGSMYELEKVTGARYFWEQGACGQGVDVALIDTGVVPVNGLTYPDKIVNGPDISFETSDPSIRYLDTNGHGTHMAGIIGGRDDAANAHNIDTRDDFLGMAPCSRIVSVKVANAMGATDVSQVLAAIDWVVQHRRSSDLNIKVLNLSFGTDGTQDYRTDPLTYAVEVAWRKGITVVVAAGNQQFGSTAMNNPAYDPYVVAVGANDTKGTYGVEDDEIPSWSAKGDGVRNPDVVAPGKSVISLRSPGSHIDDLYGSTATVNERFFKGSGTSQAAAAVSGAAALILSKYPNLTPDQVKGFLMETATRLPSAESQAQGSGMIDLLRASKAEPTYGFQQQYPKAKGNGSLEAARGSGHVVAPNGTELTGERDIMGSRWYPWLWPWVAGRGWVYGIWNGKTWSGTGWSGTSWSGKTWSGKTWSGTGWSGTGWSGTGWSGKTWSGTGWSGTGWSGTGWSGTGWSGTGWSGTSWSGTGWS